MTRPTYFASASLGAVALVVSVLACGSNQNFEEREAYARSIGQVDDPSCIGTCRPDPGSRPVDCAGEEEGYEFLTVWDFETPATNPSPPPNSIFPAQYMYSYTDATSFYFEPRGWEPNAIEWDFCPGATEGYPNHVLRFFGGPFLAWGGGFGADLANLLNGTADNCDDPEIRADHCPPLDSEFPEYTVDLSDWEGISFWARRGPDGQPGLRAMIGDKYTSDELAMRSYIADPDAPRYCERVLQCTCDAKDRTCFELPRNTCSNWGYYSGLPDMVKVCLLPREVEGYLAGDENAIDCSYPFQRCQESACNWEILSDPDSGLDPQFEGRACTEYSFRGSITAGYCFNPGEDPDPAEGNQRCGDHWMRPVQLTTDWQFYKVPFDTLLQQGWAKESDFLDLTSASVIRFTFDRGWLDVYIDNVRFYRKARDGSSDSDE